VTLTRPIAPARNPDMHDRSIAALQAALESGGCEARCLVTEARPMSRVPIRSRKASFLAPA